MDNSNVVSKITRVLNRFSKKITLLQGSSNSTTQQSMSSNEQAKVVSHRLYYIRRRLSEKGFSAQASEIMSKAWRNSTSKQYEYCWRKWHIWCISKQYNPFTPTLVNFINFLAHLFRQGKSYSCINSYKCAICQTLVASDNIDLSNNPAIKKFMKGVFNIRPPKPRYNSVWDVSKLLSYLKTLFPTSEISIKQLTLKCVALLALTSVQRIQSLASLEISCIEFFDDKIVLNTSVLLKTSTPKNPYQQYIINCYKDKSLCPVLCLKEYLHRTKKVRKSKKLFVSFKTFKSVSSSTIARWLTLVLVSSGIDTSIYKAHSYRSASSSAAKRAGMSVNNILKHANWKSANTFYKFYYKKTDSSKNFTDSVFSTK